MTTLEKIRAEIEQTTDNYNPASDAYDGGYVMAIRDVLQIIDKYASEECDNDCEHCAWTECPKEPEAMSEEMIEHYRKLAEHYDRR